MDRGVFSDAEWELIGLRLSHLCLCRRYYPHRSVQIKLTPLRMAQFAHQLGIGNRVGPVEKPPSAWPQIWPPKVGGFARMLANDGDFMTLEADNFLGDSQTPANHYGLPFLMDG